MLIDAHAHIFPVINGYNGHGIVRSDKRGLVRYGSGESSRLLPPSFAETSFPAESFIDYMDWIHVDHAVLMQGPLYGDLNEFVLSAVGRWPDRLTAAGMIDPYIKDAAKSLEWLIEVQRFRILKLECSQEYGLSGLHADLNYLDDRFALVWKRADRARLTAVVDTGAFDAPSCDVASLEAVSKKYDGLRFVFPHLLFPPGEGASDEKKTQWRRSLRLGRLPNVWFDISSLVGIAGDEYPFPAAQTCIKTAVEEVGAEKLIFGTDAPGIFTKCTYEQAIRFVDHHCTFLSKTDLNLIMAKNAIAVYGIELSRHSSGVEEGRQASNRK